MRRRCHWQDRYADTYTLSAFLGIPLGTVLKPWPWQSTWEPEQLHLCGHPFTETQHRNAQSRVIIPQDFSHRIVDPLIAALQQCNETTRKIKQTKQHKTNVSSFVRNRSGETDKVTKLRLWKLIKTHRGKKAWLIQNVKSHLCLKRPDAHPKLQTHVTESRSPGKNPQNARKPKSGECAFWSSAQILIDSDSRKLRGARTYFVSSPRTPTGSSAWCHAGISGVPTPEVFGSASKNSQPTQNAR